MSLATLRPINVLAAIPLEHGERVGFQPFGYTGGDPLNGYWLVWAEKDGQRKERKGTDLVTIGETRQMAAELLQTLRDEANRVHAAAATVSESTVPRQD